MDNIAQKTLKNFPDSASIRIKLAKIEVIKKIMKKLYHYIVKSWRLTLTPCVKEGIY